jgi:glycosyltransferase involved in cell wall biosynthesis
MDPPVQGGSLAIWIYQVARRCARRGHETFILANHGSPLHQGGTHHEGVAYIYTATGVNSAVNKGADAARALLRRFGVRAAVPAFASLWSDFGYAIQVGRRLRDLRCDAVLLMNYSQLVPVIRWLHPACRIYLYMQCEWLTQLDRETMRKRIQLADIVGGCSEYITNKIAVRFPEHGHKCVTLHNAAVPATDGSDRAGVRPCHQVLFVGRVSPEKGVHVIVDAFHEVLRQFPEARLHIVGGIGSAPPEFLVGLSDEPQVTDLRRFYETGSNGGKDPYLVHLERAAGPELGKRIILEGRVDHDQTSAAYARASVLVNPSLSESFGMSLVEAMMHGVPVVASRIGGMPYIVKDGETGLLVDADNPKTLATAICHLLGDESRARRMGEAGRKRALEHFTWDRTADTLLEQLSGPLN